MRLLQSHVSARNFPFEFKIWLIRPNFRLESKDLELGLASWWDLCRKPVSRSGVGINENFLGTQNFFWPLTGTQRYPTSKIFSVPGTQRYPISQIFRYPVPSGTGVPLAPTPDPDAKIRNRDFPVWNTWKTQTRENQN